MRRLVALLMAVGMILAARPAAAVGEQVTDIRVLGNGRTEEDTVRSLAGIKIGDSLESDTLATVRERLNTSGLFADVNVWWEAQGGVRVNIAVKDKFPWAPVPTGSWSANNKSAGLLFVHGNLFGRGKQMVIGGRLASIDSGAVLAYRDPALFGTWIYWELKGVLQSQHIPEYDINTYNRNPVAAWRETHLVSYGLEPALGIAWFRRVKTQVSWRLEQVNYHEAKLFDQTDPVNGGMGAELPPDPNTPASIRGGTVGMARAGVAFDWRAREHAVMMGPALGGTLDYSSPTFRSDFSFWRANIYWEHGIRVFRRHNFIYSFGGTLGKDLPLWWETTAGGNNLRGYLGQQFRGDTQLNARAEYHFPLFSIGSLDFRALGFCATWPRGTDSSDSFRPRRDRVGNYRIRQSDQRTFNPNYAYQGSDLKRDVHNDVGGGLRFFLRSVAVPWWESTGGMASKARSGVSLICLCRPTILRCRARCRLLACLGRVLVEFQCPALRIGVSRNMVSRFRRCPNPRGGGFSVLCSASSQRRFSEPRTPVFCARCVRTSRASPTSKPA